MGNRPVLPGPFFKNEVGMQGEVFSMEGSIAYFEKRGKENTGKTVEIAKRRALELGISEVVIASTHGYSALQAAQVFSDTDTRITAVSISPTFDDVGWRMTEVISIGGTDEGVDTAIVAIPAFARKIKEYRVLEILCKPRMA